MLRKSMGLTRRDYMFLATLHESSHYQKQYNLMVHLVHSSSPLLELTSEFVVGKQMRERFAFPSSSLTNRMT
jgi:hypothetical protein